MNVKEIAYLDITEMPLDELAELLAAAHELDAGHAIVAAYKLGYKRGREDQKAKEEERT